MLKEGNIIYKHPLLVLVCFTVAVRAIVYFLYGYTVTTPDSEEYLHLSKLLSSFNLSGYEGRRSPGYPLLLSLIGNNFSIIVFLQLMTGMISILFAYKICRLVMGNQKRSIILSLILAVYIPWMFYDFAILTESFSLLFVMAVFYSFFRILYERDATKLQYIILSLLVGYLVLIKPFYVFLPVLFFCFLALQKRILRQPVSAFLLIIPFFVFLGWSYVNKVNTGQFTSTTFYGFNIAQNCVGFAEKTTPEYADIGNIYARHRDEIKKEGEKGNVAMAIWAAYPELKEETGLAFPDLSKKLYAYSIATIKLNPTAYLKQVFVSWNDFWRSSIFLPSYDFRIKENNEALYYLSFAEQKVLRLIKILFILLIPVNFVIAFRKKELTPPFIISVVVLAASMSQALVTFGSNYRFSYPFEMLIVISFTLNIINLIEWGSKKKRTEIKDVSI